MIEREIEPVLMIRALLSARQTWDAQKYDERIPVFSHKMLTVAKAVLGIAPMSPNKSGVRSWRLPPDWPARVARAGIDPQTLELVDLGKWQIAVKATEQARELKMQERAKRDVREGLREATAKYRPPTAPRPSELIRNHVMTGRIVKELRKGDDNT